MLVKSLACQLELIWPVSYKLRIWKCVGKFQPVTGLGVPGEASVGALFGRLYRLGLLIQCVEKGLSIDRRAWGGLLLGNSFPRRESIPKSVFSGNTAVVHRSKKPGRMV